jgi:hypothetical protein
VELTTVLITHRHPFSNSIGLDGNALDDALDASLAAFTADIEAAVPSYVGIQLTIRQNGHPVTLTRLAPHRTATIALRIPLTVLGPDFDPDIMRRTSHRSKKKGQRGDIRNKPSINEL